MRINIRVAVSGKMFGGGENILRLQTHRKSDGKTRHVIRIFTVTANIYHGIIRIVIDINDRCKHLLNA